MNSFLDDEPRYILGLDSLHPDKIVYIMGLMESGMHFACTANKLKARIYNFHDTMALLRMRMMCSESLPRVWDNGSNMDVTDVIYVYVS